MTTPSTPDSAICHILISRDLCLHGPDRQKPSDRSTVEAAIFAREADYIAGNEPEAYVVASIEPVDAEHYDHITDPIARAIEVSNADADGEDEAVMNAVNAARRRAASLGYRGYVTVGVPADFRTVRSISS
jgi:hypothetical protein